MALALRNAAPLRSDIALAQAISEFERLLTPEQKMSFKDLRNRALRSAPSTDDVMRLTADINQRLVTRRQSSSSMYRCFGTRFTNVLQCLQRYAALGDVVVGGSQNIIACGVWALVRITIQICIGFGTYLDKVSHFFMTAGQTAPRYESMAHLYSRSSRLDKYMSHYLLVIVQTCQRFIQFSRKPFLGQLVSSLDDSKIQDAQADLARWASCIREEIAFVTSETVEHEATKNNTFRALVDKRYAWEAQQRILRQRATLMAAISATDHETPYKQARKCGTSTIFHHDTTYQAWKASQQPASLLLLGKLGSGKSVTMASIVDDLYLSKQDYTITYFFCRHDNTEGLTARAVIGSFCRQAISRFFDDSLLDNIMDSVQSHLKFSDVMVLVKRILPPDKQIFFILDGIDECPAYEAHEIIKAIRSLQECLRLSICVSYRSGIQDHAKIFGSNMKTLVMTDENPDIASYIDAELRLRIENKRLILGNEDIIPEIREALLQGANGMFLWVALQLDCLCEEKTDLSIRTALRDLPPDLFTTFVRILQRCRDASPMSTLYQIKILQLIVAACRPLSIHELREVLSVEPGVLEWNPERLVNDVHGVLACCGSLVIMDEENLSVRITHQSVTQFLLHKNGGVWHFTHEQAQRHMGECSMTYLNYSVFDTRMTSKVAQNLPVGQFPAQLIRKRGPVGELALKLLRSASKPDFDAKHALNEAVSQRRQHRPKEMFHFFGYASTFWLRHTSWISKDSSMYTLWTRLLENPMFSDLAWMEGSASRNDTMTDIKTENIWTLSRKMMWAIAHGHRPLYRYELRGRDWVRAFSTIIPYLGRCLACEPRPEIGADMCTLLLPWVVMVKSDPVVEWLVSMGARIPVDPTSGSSSPLSDADYPFIRALILHRKQDPIQSRCLLFQAALQRRDVHTARLVLKQDIFVPLDAALSDDLHNPAVVKIIYHMLQRDDSWIDKIDVEKLCWALRILHLTVNTNILNPTTAILASLSRSLSMKEIDSLASLILLRSSIFGDSDIITALLPWLKDCLYEEHSALRKSGAKGSLELRSMIKALHSRSPNRRKIVEDIWLSSDWDCYMQHNSLLKEVLLRCMQLREWELAKLFLQWMNKQGAKISLSGIPVIEQYAAQGELISCCASSCDYEGLTFLKQVVCLDLGRVVGVPSEHFGHQNPLEAALRASFETWDEYMLLSKTINILLTSHSRPYVSQKAYPFEALVDLTEKLCHLDIPEDEWDFLRHANVAALRSPGSPGNFFTIMMTRAIGMDRKYGEQASRTVLRTTLERYFKSKHRGLSETNSLNRTLQPNYGDETAHYCYLIESVLSFKVQADIETLQLLSGNLVSSDRDLVRLLDRYEYFYDAERDGEEAESWKLIKPTTGHGTLITKVDFP